MFKGEFFFGNIHFRFFLLFCNIYSQTHLKNSKHFLRLWELTVDKVEFTVTNFKLLGFFLQFRMKPDSEMSKSFAKWKRLSAHLFLSPLQAKRKLHSMFVCHVKRLFLC